MKKKICLVIVYLFNLLPIKQNKIFLFSYYGSQYGCNPKYITDYILENYPNKFDIVWAFNDPKSKSDLKDFRQVKSMSLRYFYELCTAKVIITNYRTTDLFIKRKNQYYIQTWHSSLRLKQIEKDAEQVLPPNYISMAKQDSLKCNLLLSGCKKSTDIFKRSFWYEGEIFEHGTPRNDLFFQSDFSKRETILRKLMLPSDARILLYAPTFRNKYNSSVYDIDYRKLTGALHDKFGGNWVILVKLHPHLVSQMDNIRFGKNIINVTTYDDIQELMFISDILISDYSSLIFDFALTDRPCFLYIPDVHEYTQSERKLYFNMNELPFIYATTNNELFIKMKQFNEKEYVEDLQIFLHRIGSYEEGRACEYLVNRIKEVCFNDGRDNVNEAI